MVLSAVEKSKARKGDRDCQGGDMQFFMAWAERPQPGQWLLNQESDCWAKTILHLYQLSPLHFQLLGKQFIKL